MLKTGGGWDAKMKQVVPWDKRALMVIQQAPVGALENGGDSLVPGFFLLWRQYEKKTPKQMVEDQNGKCPECDAEIEATENVMFTTYKGNFCYYTGFFMCTSCCSGKRKAVVPSYLIFRGDAEPKCVSNMAFAFLTSIYRLPLINITKKNRKLSQVHRSFRMLLALHQRLKHLKNFVHTCKKRDTLQRWVQDAHPVKSYSLSHLLEKAPTFSLFDLAHAINHDNASVVELTQKLVNHVTSRECTSCSVKGFYCDNPNCKAKDTISFSFQVERVLQCRTCKDYFHRECYSPSTCTKCARIKAMNKQAAAASE